MQSIAIERAIRIEYIHKLGSLFAIVLFLLYKTHLTNVWVHTPTNILPIVILCFLSFIVINISKQGVSLYV